VSVSIINKTTTRLPEAMLLKIKPEGVTAMDVSLSKLAGWINANDTVIDGSQKLHFVDDNGVLFQVRLLHLLCRLCRLCLLCLDF
jgi:hypothetical protein